MNPRLRDTRLLAESTDQLSAVQWLLEDKHNQDAPSSAGRPPHQQPGEGAMRHTLVRQLMSPAVQCATTSTSVRETAQVMQASECDCIVVLEQNAVVGLVTERDMIKILADVMVTCPAEKLSIKDFMSAPPPCLNENATLQDALRLVQSRNVGQIPILDQSKRLVGLLSRNDLAKAQVTAIERDAIEQQVYSRSRELREANQELQALALQDSLLKVGNRRAMERDVQASHLNAVRYGQSYALGLIDVDYFKRYNDHYGHCAGDKALVTVANCIQDSIRRGDRVYRYGGEELLVLMPETSLTEAMEAVCRLTDNLFHLNLEHSKSPLGRLTISAGVSAFTGTDADLRESWQAVLEEADAFLYRAKELGRNQTYGALEEGPVHALDRS